VRIVIAEDLAILRDGLAQLLGMRGHDVVAVGDVPALHATVDARPIDVAVIDIRMPPRYTDEGLRAAIEMRQRHPRIGVLLFSQYVETRFARDLVADGATGIGYLLKERVSDIDEFIGALERVAAGGTALDPEVIDQLFGASRRDDAVSRLTRREREVLHLMAEGRTNAGIAAAFVITERAVEKHVANIFTKLGLTTSQHDHRRVMAVLRYLERR